MPIVQHNKNSEPPEKLPMRGLTRNRILRTIIEDIYKRLKLKVSVDGLQAQEIEGGIHLKSDPGSTEMPGPFEVTASADGATFSVASGTFNSVTPSYVETDLALGGGAKWIYLKVVYSLTASASNYVYAATFTSVEVHAAQSSEISTPHGPSTGTYYILLAKFTDGTKDQQYALGNYSAYLTGGGSSQATLHVSDI